MVEYKALFGQAALVARQPDAFHSVPGLAPDQVAALEYEKDHKWRAPKMMWFAVSLCAIGAATQGWDQTGSNGANLSFPIEFGLEDENGNSDAFGFWIIGLVNSIIFLTAGLMYVFLRTSSLPPRLTFSQRSMDCRPSQLLPWASRRDFPDRCVPDSNTYWICFYQKLASSVRCPVRHGYRNWSQECDGPHLFCRACSTQDPRRIGHVLATLGRGRYALVSATVIRSTADSSGIFLGFAANVIVRNTGAISWRLQLGSAFIPSFILLCGIWFCPESPRWLMKKGRHHEAFQSMSKIRSHPIIAARDFYYSYILYVEEHKVARGAGYFQRLWDCFSIPRIRRANYGASTVMLAQQMCGINIISFYSSTIFRNAGYSSDQALFASLGYGAIQVVSTIPTLFLIDTKGRRRLCLITFPLMCTFLLAAGLSLLNPTSDGPAKIGPVVLFVYLFTICYGLGEGPVAFQYSAEVFPTIQREQGMAWAVFINNFFAGVLSLTFPRMQAPDVMGPTGAFGFYAGLNLVAWLMIFCFVRETKQLTLEELDQVFSVPTAQFIRYEASVRVPWFLKRYLLFRRGLVEPPVSIGKNLGYGET